VCTLLPEVLPLPPTLCDERAPGVGWTLDGPDWAHAVVPPSSNREPLAPSDAGENELRSGRASARAKPARMTVCFNFICRSSSERDLSPHLEKRPESHERDKVIYISTIMRHPSG
jgi:hypothetical protein